MTLISALLGEISQLALTKSVAGKTKGRKSKCVWQVPGLGNIGLFFNAENKLISDFRAKLALRKVLRVQVAITVRN